MEYDYRFQKLALENELKQMEEQAKDGQLGELAVVAPILQKIAADTTVINVSRARAQRLLALAGK